LAQSNKSSTAKANKRQETYRQRYFGRLAKLANGHLWLSIGRDAQATHANIFADETEMKK
jgi:hypothetical protein